VGERESWINLKVYGGKVGNRAQSREGQIGKKDRLEMEE